MVHYPNSSLRAGQIQFADPSAFVNNLSTYQVVTRPNKRHWANNRPAVLLKIPDLQRQLHFTGNQPDSRTLIQYYPSDKTKLFLDCETYSDTEQSAAEAFAAVNTAVLQPIITFIHSKTGKQIFVDELAIECACRPVANRFKQSFHIYFPDVAVTAKRIKDLLEHLEIPAIADRSPYNGEH